MPPVIVRPSRRKTDDRATVLLVDDDPMLLGLLTRWLAAEPIRLLTATNGMQALDVLTRDSVQLVVTDWKLPGMNGLRLLDTVLKRWPGVGRILLTGFADSDLVLDAHAKGHRVLSKELDPGIIKRTIVRTATR